MYLIILATVQDSMVVRNCINVKLHRQIVCLGVDIFIFSNRGYLTILVDQIIPDSLKF